MFDRLYVKSTVVYTNKMMLTSDKEYTELLLKT